MSVSAGRQVKRLVLVFCAWKTLLFLLAAYCPGPGYDTSSLILLDPSVQRHNHFHAMTRFNRFTINLFRWDALYFVKAAERGQVHEQAWAFSGVYSHLLRISGHVINADVQSATHHYVLAGIIMSNVCHLLSVLVLYRLLTLVLEPQPRQAIPFIAAVLHILTPASLFMCAPYAEAMFSLLNFIGMLLYAQSKAVAGTSQFSLYEDVQKLGAGLFFAAATLMRSNGLLSGTIFLYDVAGHVPNLLLAQWSIHDARRLLVTCLAGSLIALAFIGPQYLAYVEFCNRESDAGVRPWCEERLPSIYSWVQSHYWNVGLFRYWTVSNLPLFILAAPMSWLMFASSVTVLRSCVQRPFYGHSVHATNRAAGPGNGSPAICNLPELALPQLLLAITAVFSFHVQIVNRIASGYPIWYLVIATWVVDSPRTLSNKDDVQKAQWPVRGIVLYSLVQGMLFANFLPPA